MFDSSSKRALELDDRRHLLSTLRRAHQRLDDRRIPARSVERLLDREDLGIVGCAGDEVDDGVERLVRVLQQHVLLADDGEDVVGLAQGRHGVRLERFVVKRPVLDARKGEEVPHVEHAAHVVDVLVRIELEGLDQLGKAGRRHIAGDLEPYGVATLAPP